MICLPSTRVSWTRHYLRSVGFFWTESRAQSSVGHTRIVWSFPCLQPLEYIPGPCLERGKGVQRSGNSWHGLPCLHFHCTLSFSNLILSSLMYMYRWKLQWRAIHKVDGASTTLFLTPRRFICSYLLFIFAFHSILCIYYLAIILNAFPFFFFFCYSPWPFLRNDAISFVLISFHFFFFYNSNYLYYFITLTSASLFWRSMQPLSLFPSLNPCCWSTYLRKR